MSFNSAVADRFAHMARLIELLGDEPAAAPPADKADKAGKPTKPAAKSPTKSGGSGFRALAMAKAARVIADHAADLESIAKDPDAKKLLQAIEGIGPRIADKIIEFAATERIAELDDLRARVPAGLVPLMDVPGLGPKTLAMLWHEGGVVDLASLNRIIADGSILKLPRMGQKSVDKLVASIALLGESRQRLHLGPARAVADRILAVLRELDGVRKLEAAGSLRRGKDTVGDIDILIATTKPALARDTFKAMPEVTTVLAAGESRTSVRVRVTAGGGRWDQELAEGTEAPTIQVDLRVIPEASWGAALMYFTGSKEHNVALRERALTMGLTLNEYGLFPNDDEPTPPQSRGIKPVAAKTEADVYAAFGLQYIPPELREDRGELDAFAKGTTPPRVIELDDIRAELHAHTTASDGRMSIVELAQSAKSRGFHTIAVTDHSRSSPIAGGLSPERLVEHIKAVHAARAKVKGITILAGSEVDILADGTLDYDDELLAKLDIVVASPHHALSQEPDAATARLLKAISHPLVHILGHPTGRLINRRKGLDPDMPALIAAAKKRRTALEINSHWMRLDLRDAHVRAARDAGCLIAIDCDVHDESDFDCLPFGVATARRGWLGPEQCVNTWPADKLHAWLKSKR